MYLPLSGYEADSEQCLPNRAGGTAKPENGRLVYYMLHLGQLIMTRNHIAVLQKCTLYACGKQTFQVGS